MADRQDTLQDQVEEQKTPKKFGMFGGVFTPTLLTILGVIMYLRTGWVVGNAGLLWGFAIILLAFTITLFTGLSLSSITTNIRIGAGGAFSMISQSLGLEIGGSIGIPLYLAQALAVAMYIFGFRTGWLSIFPEHPAILVDLGTFGALFLIAFISANLAFRVQYVIMAIIAASLVSVFATVFTGAMQYDVTWIGEFPGAPETGFQGIGFWAVFAVFFPAATGILAGANLSGDLENPRRSIPVGTMAAIGLSLVIYLAVAYWLARVATPDELVSNYTVMVDKALYGPAVLADLLGATFSSGLASLVGAPRILQALGEHDIFPGSKRFAEVTGTGEPRNALWFSGAIVLLALLLRDLNAIAPLITMFFLITYAMINVVVLIEKRLGLVSFRPLLDIPFVVPLVGTAGCLFAMFIVNATFGIVAVVLVFAIYAYLTRRTLEAPFQDVRSGLFVAVAEWAAKNAMGLPGSHERAWKPNLLVPVEDPSVLRGSYDLIRDVAYPKGSVRLVGLVGSDSAGRVARSLPALARAFRGDGVFATSTLMDEHGYAPTVLASMQTMGGAFFKPNMVFLQLPDQRDQAQREAVAEVIADARSNAMGVLVLGKHHKAQLGRRQRVALWIRDQSPDWELSMRLGNVDLALLTAYKLMQNWRCDLQVITAVEDGDYVDDAHTYLNDLVDLARMPGASVVVEHCDFTSCVERRAHADLNIFGIGDEPDLDFMYDMIEQTDASCVFVRDSGVENALA